MQVDIYLMIKGTIRSMYYNHNSRKWITFFFPVLPVFSNFNMFVVRHKQTMELWTDK
jgi:hypothetical protein